MAVLGRISRAFGLRASRGRSVAAMRRPERLMMPQSNSSARDARWIEKMPEPFPVCVVRYMLILAAIVLAPVYAAWIAGGAIADQVGQRRR
jgi:hypothetical protein